MRTLGRALAAGVALLAAAACGGSSGGSGGGGGDSGLQAAIQGTWASCQVSGASSGKTVLAVSGTSFTTTGTLYANTTCAGTGTLLYSQSGTFTLGAAVTANLGATPVTAYKLDVTAGGTTSYDLVYIDAGAIPNRLYLGDTSGANDGSTPALRPTALDSTVYLSRQ